MRGQIGNDSWRSAFVEGRICLKLGKIQFSAVTQKANFSGLLSFQAKKRFSDLQEFVLPVSRNTCWFVYCSQMREQSGGGEAIGFSVERAQVSPAYGHTFN